jgi:hypothetical protein
VIRETGMFSGVEKFVISERLGFEGSSLGTGKYAGRGWR